MYRSSAKRLYAFIVSVGFLLSSAATLIAAEQVGQTPKVRMSVKNGKSAPLRDYKVQGPLLPQRPREVKNKQLPPKASAPGMTDPAVQRSGLSTPPPSELGQFEGGSDDDNAAVIGGRIAPPDTDGDVGPSHYVQYINLIVTVFDKSGTVLAGPAPGNVFWDGLGDDCETRNDGDPIVLYDQFADRWFVSQFAFPAFPNPPYIQCIAVSVTGDPTGEYYQYQFNLPDTYLNDYPKFGVWPDGYYMTANGFDLFGGGFQGMAIAFDRAAMLDGLPATMIEFNTGQEGGVLPSDADGLTTPPEGAPNYFLTFNLPPARLVMWAFHADFETPANSTFTQLSNLLVDDFVVPICGSERDQCVPQLDSGELLETLSQATMNRLAYRNFGDHQSLVVNHTVAVDGAAAIRWYELQIPGEPAAPQGEVSNPWVVHQQSTYAPDDNWRWMGSIAQDGNGNVALGYSISSEEMHPSIAIAGRLATDPLNTLGAEDIFLEGTGSQINTISRWGDYSSMNVDPLDDCTFWYTQQYYQATGNFDWNTRVASFKYPGCLAPGTGKLEGTVTDGANPLEGVTVTAGAASTQTDAAGHYEFTLPADTYDMTATKYGFFPAVAEDVVVPELETTTQNFTLEEAPSQLVNGTVRDSETNWALYARIDISGTGFPGATVWTDPVTGYYGLELVEGITYTFVINAVSPGYLPGGGTLPLGVPVNVPLLVQNWTLDADAGACTAPGYTPTEGSVVLFEDFSGGAIPEGWDVTNESTGGEGPSPTEWVAVEGSAPCDDYAGNLTGGTGFFVVANSDCPGPTVIMDTSLITPSVDLSASEGAILRFKQDYNNIGPDIADVDVSVDGGTTWTNVLRQTADLRGDVSVNITSLAGGESDVKVRFHYYNAAWAWWWQVDDIEIAGAGCNPGTGGLVVGNVYDSAGNGLNDATVTNIGGESTTTFETPDPGQADGFYILYAEAGPNVFEASKNLYQTAQGQITVVPSAAQRLDFSLQSGNLSASPSALNARVNPGGTENQTLTLTNTGAAPATFEIREINQPAPPPLLARGPYADPDRIRQALARLPRGWQKEVAASGRYSLGKFGAIPGRTPISSRPLAAGDVITTYPASIAFPNGLPFGAMLNTTDGSFFVSNLSFNNFGDDMDYGFTAEGVETGETIDMSSLGFFPMDGTFNTASGKFWQATNDFFGGTNTCVYEIDPATNEMTGNTICPDFPSPQTGLAYDPNTDTYYSGSFFDSVINHFDADGTILDSVDTDGLQISGLAFNPETNHLFVFNQIVPGGPADDVWVLVPANDYSVFGSFPVGAPGITESAGGGMEMDCDGHLIMIDQNGVDPILIVDSGEGTGLCGYSDTIPWVSEEPIEGTIPGVGATAAPGAVGNEFPVAVTFDSGTMLPGLQQAQLGFVTDTPNGLPRVPLSITVRFLDVPDTNLYEAYIYGVAGASVMFGGPPVCPLGILYFCPGGPVTRADMAGYLWRGFMGANTPPPVYQNIFTDVTFNSYNSFYIQGIHDFGITAGCTPTTFCPNSPITREQMAVFIWKGKHGDEPPPECEGTFADVPCDSPYADYIQGIYNEGITAGCNANPLLFCPTEPIINGQMAVFLAKAFNIPVLLPED